jgi:hypothetical protein
VSKEGAERRKKYRNDKLIAAEGKDIPHVLSYRARMNSTEVVWADVKDDVSKDQQKKCKRSNEGRAVGDMHDK